MIALRSDSLAARMMDRLMDLCLVSILLAAPLVFYTHGHDVFELNKIMVVRVLSALAAMLLFARLLLSRPIAWVRSPLDWPLLTFLVVSFICTFHTANLYLSIHGVYEDFEGITTLVMYVFLCWWMVQHVRSLRQIHLFIGAVILAGTLAGFYGILQNFQIDFVPWNPATYSKNRLFATMGNPNFLAAYLVMSLPLCFIVFLDLPEKIKTDKLICFFLILGGLLVSLGLIFLFNIDYFNFNPSVYDASGVGRMLVSQKFLAAHIIVFFPLIAAVLLYFGRLKIVFLISMLFQIIAIEFTKSRGGFLAMGAFALVLLAFFVWEYRRNSEVLKRNRWWLLSFVAVVLAVSIFYQPVHETVMESLQRLAALADKKHFTLTPRLYIWRSALRMLRDHFWFGTGLDTFQVVFPRYRMALYWILEWNGTPEKAHNVVLQTAATMGMVGLTVFFWILAAFTWKTFKALKAIPQSSGRMLVAGSFAAVLAFFVQDLFSFTVVGYGSLFWMLMGLVPAMERVYCGRADEEERRMEEAQELPFLRLPSLLALGIGLVLFAWHSTRIWVADSFYKQGQIGMQVGRWDYAVAMFQKAAGHLAGTTNEQVQAALQPSVDGPKVTYAPGLNPDQELYWVKLGIGLESGAAAQPKPEDKEKIYMAALLVHQHTLEMNPINGYNYNNKGRVLKSMGESLNRRDYLEKAVAHYAKAIELDPNNVYFNLDQANCYLDLGEWEKGMQICQSLIERFPDFAVPYSYAAFINMKQNRANEAIELFKKALSKDWKADDSSAALAATNLGTLLVNKGRLQEAVDVYQRAISLNPGLPEAYINLGQIQVQLGRRQDAINTYRKLLEISKDHPTALKMLKQLGAQ